jgi:hypothetical protein
MDPKSGQLASVKISLLRLLSGESETLAEKETIKPRLPPNCYRLLPLTIVLTLVLTRQKTERSNASLTLSYYPHLPPATEAGVLSVSLS